MVLEAAHFNESELVPFQTSLIDTIPDEYVDDEDIVVVNPNIEADLLAQPKLTL